jgi:small subunit ribosomal protein S20
MRDAMQGTDKAKATAAAKLFISTIDKAVKAGRIHRNSANRHKSTVNKALAKLA